MTEEEFVKTAVEINKEIGLTEEQSEAIAKLTLMLENNNLQREFFETLYHDLGASKVLFFFSKSL